MFSQGGVIVSSEQDLTFCVNCRQLKGITQCHRVFEIVGYSTTGKVTALSKPQVILARNTLYIYTTMSFTGLTSEKYNLSHHCMDKGV